jgi:hypothetical protein
MGSQQRIPVRRPKKDPGFENKIIGNKTFLERNFKNKRFQWIETALSDLFSIFKTNPSIDYGCQPSSQKKKRKVEPKEVDPN